MNAMIKCSVVGMNVYNYIHDGLGAMIYPIRPITSTIAVAEEGLVGKHVPPDGTRWNRMQDAENRLIVEPAPIGTEPIGRTEM